MVVYASSRLMDSRIRRQRWRWKIIIYQSRAKHFPIKLSNELEKQNKALAERTNMCVCVSIRNRFWQIAYLSRHHIRLLLGIISVTRTTTRRRSDRILETRTTLAFIWSFKKLTALHTFAVADDDDDDILFLKAVSFISKNASEVPLAVVG